MPNPITDRKLRIAIVGCGRIAKNHFGAIERHADDLELVGVCDNHPATLQAHTDTYRIPGLRTSPTS